MVILFKDIGCLLLFNRMHLNADPFPQHAAGVGFPTILVPYENVA